MTSLDAPPTGAAKLHDRSGMVKICGLRDETTAIAAVAAGADMLGMVFAPSRRQISPEVARSVASAARSHASSPVSVLGVFVNASAVEINRVAATVGLTAVQLHGDEPPVMLDEIEVPVMIAIRPRPGASASDVIRQLDALFRPQNAPFAVLLDGYSELAAGGSGVRADWAIAAAVAARYPTILAGGLNPTSVEAAIAQVKPLAVDVSSGVETNGAKDPIQIASFIVHARQAYSAMGYGKG